MIICLLSSSNVIRRLLMALPGFVAYAPIPIGCGPYLFTLNPDGEPATMGCGLYLEPAKYLMLAAAARRNRLALVQKPQPRLKPGWALGSGRLAGICNTDSEV